MIKVIVQPGQTLADLTVRHKGDASALLEVAKANNLSPTDALTAGTEITIPGDPINRQLVRHFNKRNINPATGQTAANATPEPQLGGIGYWAIETEFIVS